MQAYIAVWFVSFLAAFKQEKGSSPAATTWKVLLSGAVGSWCFMEMPRLCQLLLQEEQKVDPWAELWEEGVKLWPQGDAGLWHRWFLCNCFLESSLQKWTPRACPTHWSGALCPGTPGKTQPLGVMTKELAVSQFSKGLLPTLVLSLLLVSGARLVLNQVSIKKWKKLSNYLEIQTCGLILVVLTLPFSGSKVQLIPAAEYDSW